MLSGLWNWQQKEKKKEKKDEYVAIDRRKIYQDNDSYGKIVERAGAIVRWGWHEYINEVAGAVICFLLSLFRTRFPAGIQLNHVVQGVVYVLCDAHHLLCGAPPLGDEAQVRNVITQDHPAERCEMGAHHVLVPLRFA